MSGPRLTPAEREAAVERLSEAFSRDIIPVEEFERRVDGVYRAATAPDLRELLSDLPVAVVPAPEASRRTAAPAGRSGPPVRRELDGRITSVLGSVERSGPMVVPGRVEVRTTLGNVELDLRDAVFSAPVTEIRLDALLANVEIQLPHDVEVRHHGRAFLANFEIHATQGGEGPRGVVRVSGRAFLSNVEFVSGGRGR